MNVGINIKKRRYELGMSQQELAFLMGYKTRSTIAKIESGENDVTQSKLMRFAQVLDTTVEALITGDSAYQNHSVKLTNSVGHVNTVVSPSEKNRRTAVVILAGGRSSRNQQNIPNQFIDILGKPAVVYCMEAYQAHAAIDDIYVVCLKGWEEIVSAYAEQHGITKLCGLIPAGSSGILSVRNGLEYIQDRYAPDDIIIFQESTRPLVDADTISKLLRHCYETGSSNICRPMKDILQFSHSEGKTSYIDRDSVVEIQSPEAYRFEVIQEVFDKACKCNHPLTESCCAMLMYNLGFDIGFVEGNFMNYKLLRQEDIAVITTVLRRGR